MAPICKKSQDICKKLQDVFKRRPLNKEHLKSESTDSLKDAIPTTTPTPQTPLDIPSSELWLQALERVQEREDWAVFCKIIKREDFAYGGHTKSFEQHDRPYQISQIEEVARAAAGSKDAANSTYFRHFLLKTVDALTAVKDLGAAVATLNPYASIAWGVLQFMLTPVVNIHAVEVLCCEHLPEILDQATHYQLFGTIYAGSVQTQTKAEVMAVLKEVFIGILEYQLAVVRSLCSKMTKFKSAFKGETGSLPQQALRKLSKEKERLASLQAIDDREINDIQFKSIQKQLVDLRKDGITALDHITAVWSIVDQNHRRTVLDWVSPILYGNAHNAEKRRPINGTADWLLSHPDYISWNNSPTVRCLLLRGWMGTGKSCLCHAVIDDQMAQSPADINKSRVLYFYCDGTEGRSEIDSHEKILRCLVKQLADWAPNKKLPNTLLEVFKQQNSKSQLTEQQCIDLLVLMSDPSVTVKLILDGLDECKSDVQSRLIESINDMAARFGSSFKLIVSCREEPDLRLLLKHLIPLKINVPDYTEAAIRTMIDYKIEMALQDPALSVRYTSGSEDKAAEVRETLIKNARGMFRWVEAAFKFLHDSLNPQQFERRLLSLDRLKGLWSLYREIWESATGAHSEQSEEDKKALVMALRFLIHGVRYNFKRVCRNQVSHFPGNSRHILEACGYRQLDYLESLCPSFLIQSPQFTEDTEDGNNTTVLELPHFSVSEFLRDQYPEHFGFCISHKALASECMEVFSRGDDLQPLGPGRPEGLVLYAALSWPEHVRLLDGKGCAEPDNLGKFLLDQPCSRGYQNWIEWMATNNIGKTPARLDSGCFAPNSCSITSVNGDYTFDDPSWFVTKPYSSLFARMYLGYDFNELESQYLKVEAKSPYNVRVKDGKEGTTVTALTFAALLGDTKSIGWLHSQGHSPNQQNDRCQTSGHLLCEIGLLKYPVDSLFADALQALVDVGLDLNIKNEDGNTCFFNVLVSNRFDNGVLEIFQNQSFNVFAEEPLPDPEWGIIGDEAPTGNFSAVDIYVSRQFILDEVPEGIGPLLPLFCERFPRRKLEWLCRAAHNGRTELVKRLVDEFYVDPGTRFAVGPWHLLPLDFALAAPFVETKWKDIVDFLAPFTIKPGVELRVFDMNISCAESDGESRRPLDCFERIVQVCNLATVRLFVEHTAPVTPTNSKWGTEAITRALLYNEVHGRAIAEYFNSLGYRNTESSSIFRQWRNGDLKEEEIGRCDFSDHDAIANDRIQDDVH